MTDAQKTTVKEYVTKLDSDIQAGDLLDLVVDIVADRVLLYLNETVIADSLLRVISQVVVSAYKDNGVQHEQTIASVSDNGQTVSYHQTPVNYFGSKSDKELFTGFESLLASYRRPHVITS